MAGQEAEMMEQLVGGVVTGGQEPTENNDAKNGEPEIAAGLAACAPKAAAVPSALPRHRRSKSASSDRNAEACKHGPSHGAAEQRCGQAQGAIAPCSSKDPPGARNSCAATAGGSVHQAPRDQRPNASPNHRVSLENDVRQLQLHLHQERSIRVMLDRAIGRASSTLSPGHRHFPAQTKELIAEIELLEEEIANREQHVLTLYRSIFDQCMSGPSSGQSSGITSPAHTKSIATRTRRQPSIISSAFCSSKKLPLQPFHIMESLSESGRTKNMLNAKIKHQSFSSEALDIHPTSFPPDPRKAYLAYGIPNSSLKRMALFHKWFESILSTAMRKKCPDEKQLVQLKFGLPDCQPLALFALCTGASSDPMLRVYTGKHVMEELERAKREFLQVTVVVRKFKKKVFLPRLVERYAREACLGPDDVLPWAQREGGVAADGRPQQDAAQQGAGSRRKAAQAVEWLPYAARFRYAFARSMVDKPHC
ncbi:hypothetical protein BAE44_0000776 [Dichanthelium oligosanthes]|uniref:DUF547 domain-containing protein n=1 Tax=Dichanthelium oligosanthes TaxID=888268 RepID=A0A1E5WLJ8_9POAL|nr:hypothetical protein BAE44_0000776 [Dichanthelium oligosanthes]